MPVSPAIKTNYENVRLFENNKPKYNIDKKVYRSNQNEGHENISDVPQIKSLEILFRKTQNSIEKKIEESKSILSLNFNWNDEGALPISKNAFNKATEFLKKYSERVLDVCNDNFIPPEIVPVKDGSVDLEWHLTNSYLLINFNDNSDGVVYYYLAYKNGEHITYDANGQIDTKTINDKFASVLIGLS